MKKYKYSLEQYSSQSVHKCPDCGEKSFTRYVDNQTGVYISDDVGMCNRANKCAYAYSPKEYFIDNDIPFDTNYKNDYTNEDTQEDDLPPSFIPIEFVEESCEGSILERNHPIPHNMFIRFLFGQFKFAAERAINQYFIGSAEHWPGATVFWQIDKDGNVRCGKVMLYDQNGKRVKKPYDHIHWVHKILHLPDFNLKQCLFGEHLLTDDDKRPVAICESEKSAIIASMYLPEFIWLACGGLTLLNAQKCEVLKGRDVCLFPDLGGYEKWKAKARTLSHITRFQVSDLIENHATVEDRKKGLDIADYLIQFDHLEFILWEPENDS